MKYYLITYSAEITLSGNRIYWSKAINSNPVDYFIEVKEEEEGKQTINHYKNFALNFFTEITEEQYLRLNE
ncbi:hypothetical protein GKZ28_21950 [Clostridium chromiireducens]|uniref:Uncharacterized protein n=1 Tax=Clostridium chromiireducens TaxID=225345 RepID=A0A964RRM8_9CLOT|nr:hypothetical protein [Clostridium chromiireducens]MVX66343.1 hypothetical protein [Clostridium chromiireducens]